MLQAQAQRGKPSRKATLQGYIRQVTPTKAYQQPEHREVIEGSADDLRAAGWRWSFPKANAWLYKHGLIPQDVALEVNAYTGNDREVMKSGQWRIWTSLDADGNTVFGVLVGNALHVVAYAQLPSNRPWLACQL